MANSEYTPEALEAFKDWLDNIEAATKLRQQFPPTILTHMGGNCCRGYVDVCRDCGTKLTVEFGDYSKPLDEKFVHCVIDEDGHGVWASAINMILN